MFIRMLEWALYIPASTLSASPICHQNPTIFLSHFPKQSTTCACFLPQEKAIVVIIYPNLILNIPINFLLDLRSKNSPNKKEGTIRKETSILLRRFLEAHSETFPHKYFLGERNPTNNKSCNNKIQFERTYPFSQTRAEVEGKLQREFLEDNV